MKVHLFILVSGSAKVLCLCSVGVLEHSLVDIVLNLKQNIGKKKPYGMV